MECQWYNFLYTYLLFIVRVKHCSTASREPIITKTAEDIIHIELANERLPLGSAAQMVSVSC